MFEYNKNQDTLLVLDWASNTMQGLMGMIAQVKKAKNSQSMLFTNYQNPYLHGLEIDLTDEKSVKHGLLNVFISRFLDHLIQFNPSKIVMAMEGKRCWRKLIYPEYKMNRTHDSWELTFDYYEFCRFRDEVAQTISSLVGTHIIKVDGCEGDDVLAVVAKECRDHFDNIVISSGDRDITQLTKYPNVKVFDSKDQEFKTPLNGDVKMFLECKSVGGDKGDNIFGLLLEGKTRRIGKDGAAKFINRADGSLYDYCDSLGVLDQYLLNRQLMDLDYIPQDVYDRASEAVKTSEIVLGSFYDQYKLGLTEMNLKKISTVRAGSKLFKKQRTGLLSGNDL